MLCKKVIEGGEMDAKMIGIIVILVLLLILVGAVAAIIFYIRKKVQQLSRTLFRTNSIVQGIKKQELEFASTPKSVSGATSLYLPQIMRDFPEFHSEEMKERAELVLTTYLQSIDESNGSLLSEGTRELKDQLAMKIRGLRNQGYDEHFEQIQIHKTEINKYRKEKGRCSVVYQSAVSCVHYVMRDGKIINGYRERKSQFRYNVEVCYIQDREVAEQTKEGGMALNCPNCGAPLTSLGAKICPYCDSPVVEFNIHTWNFTDVEVVK